MWSFQTVCWIWFWCIVFLVLSHLVCTKWLSCDVDVAVIVARCSVLTRGDISSRMFPFMNIVSGCARCDTDTVLWLIVANVFFKVHCSCRARKSCAQSLWTVHQNEISSNDDNYIQITCQAWQALRNYPRRHTQVWGFIVARHGRRRRCYQTSEKVDRLLLGLMEIEWAMQDRVFLTTLWKELEKLSEGHVWRRQEGKHWVVVIEQMMSWVVKGKLWVRYTNDTSDETGTLSLNICVTICYWDWLQIIDKRSYV